MRHHKAGLKLSRTASHRSAMFRNMVTSLFKYDRIRTTDVKAKEVKRWADRLITLAKRGDLHAQRQVLAVVREKDVVHKLFEKAKERFANPTGGYTRIVKLGRRPGDAAPISLVELIVPVSEEKKKEKKKAAKTSHKKKKEGAKKSGGAKKAVKAPKAKGEKPVEKPTSELTLPEAAPQPETPKV